MVRQLANYVGGVCQKSTTGVKAISAPLPLPQGEVDLLLAMRSIVPLQIGREIQVPRENAPLTRRSCADLSLWERCRSPTAVAFLHASSGSRSSEVVFIAYTIISNMG